MLNAETDAVAINEHLLRMGQLYFNWPTPDGYPDYSEAWQGNLMPRWQFAFALIRNETQKHKTQSQFFIGCLVYWHFARRCGFAYIFIIRRPPGTLRSRRVD